MSVNTCTISGFVGRDARSVASGKMASFVVAVDDSFVRDGERVKRTSWVDVTVVGKQVDAALKVAKKGALVMVHGKLETREWEKDGEKRYSTAVKTYDVAVIKPSGSHAPTEDAPSSEDDIPF